MAYRISKRKQAATLKPKRKLNTDVTKTQPVKEASKPQITISTARILEKHRGDAVGGKEYATRRSRAREPEHELFLDYQDQVESSRKTLIDYASTALNNTQTELVEALNELQMHDATFLNKVMAHSKELLSPLSDDVIQNTVTRNGRTITETIHIGKQVEAFNTLVVGKGAELKHSWLKWEQVQSRIIQLGLDVLGAEAFEGGDFASDVDNNGYNKEMEVLDLEAQAFLAEMNEEIKLLGQEAVEKMRVAEKELDVQLRKEQGAFFTRIFAEDG